ncbi:MAG: hypothetical protein Q9195_008239 [Heterodermia aff. obscurata]
MLFPPILITAILAASQLRITHSSFTNAPRSNSVQLRNPFPPLDSHQSSHLAPRVIGTLPIPNHWTVALDTFNSFLTNAPAPAILLEFFSAIEAHASGLPAQVTQLPAVSFQLGDIELVFFGTIGNVPWSFVRNFAVLMQAMTARGVAGFFEARGVHLSGVTVFVHFRLI